MKAIAWLMVVINFVAMIVLYIAAPPARYERMADRDLRAAHAMYRRESPEKAYTMYRAVYEGYRRSSFAQDAQFYAARTAFLNLGQFEKAQAELEAFLARKPANQEHVAEAGRYLEAIKGRSDLPEAVRDEVIWEYAQALVEESGGKFESARTRLEWIIENHKSSMIGQRAAEILPRVAKKATEA